MVNPELRMPIGWDKVNNDKSKKTKVKTSPGVARGLVSCHGMRERPKGQKYFKRKYKKK